MIALALVGLVFILLWSLAWEESKVVNKLLALIVLFALLLVLGLYIAYTKLKERVDYLYFDYSKRMDYYEDKIEEVMEKTEEEQATL